MQQVVNPATDVYSFTHYKQLVDTFLADYFATQVTRANSIDPSYAKLWKTIAQLANGGGKRLRPCMVLLAYESLRPSSDAPLTSVLPAAGAVELLHLAMLIHDDIIDRDLVRYGQKNITANYIDLYSGYAGAQTKHFAQSAAMLAGDVLISQAHGMLQRCNASAATIMHIQTDLERSVFNVTGGELLDTEAAFLTTQAANPLLVAQYKTASYSFVCPLTIGAHLAEAPDDRVAMFEDFGTHLGMAYQIQDDLLGVFGDEAATGKSTSSDIREGKWTYLVEQFNLAANHNSKQAFKRIFGNPDSSAEDIAEARRLLEASGAKERAEARIKQLIKTVEQSLDALQIAPPYRHLFQQLIAMCTQRTY